MYKVQLFAGKEGWIDIKGVTEVPPLKFKFKPISCLSVSIVPDDHKVLERGNIFEDEFLGFAGCYNYICSMTDWLNSGGE